MKNIITAAILLVVQMSIGQVQKNIGDFTSVQVFDRISLELVQADENRIVITGSRANDVEVINKNGDLHIRMKLKKLLQGEDISATLFYKTIQSIDAGEGSQLASRKPIKQATVDISAKEGAEIRLVLEVDKATVKAVTGGIVNLSGTADFQDVSIGTGGVVKARRFITNQTNISMNAGGEAEIFANKIVDAKIRAGGDIKVYGNPKIEEKIVLGGTVTKVSE
ncbi:MAG TPA: head GIN domain-containing protein [Flavobacterium sp.]|jgi:hypothetical protein|nr:head GIN domain-containing protein [Flavobacterium sp.]